MHDLYKEGYVAEFEGSVGVAGSDRPSRRQIATFATAIRFRVTSLYLYIYTVVLRRSSSKFSQRAA